MSDPIETMSDQCDQKNELNEGVKIVEIVETESQPVDKSDISVLPTVESDDPDKTTSSDTNVVDESKSPLPTTKPATITEKVIESSPAKAKVDIWADSDNDSDTEKNNDKPAAVKHDSPKKIIEPAGSSNAFGSSSSTPSFGGSFGGGGFGSSGDRGGGFGSRGGRGRGGGFGGRGGGDDSRGGFGGRGRGGGEFGGRGGGFGGRGGGDDSRGGRGGRGGFGGSGANSTPREGDWMCDDCNVNNWASRFQCFKCKKDKPANAKSANPGGSNNSGGGDWLCEGCSFSNFASRFKCYKCQTPKPAPTPAAKSDFGTGGSGNADKQEEGHVSKRTESEGTDKKREKGRRRRRRRDSSSESDSESESPPRRRHGRRSKCQYIPYPMPMCMPMGGYGGMGVGINSMYDQMSMMYGGQFRGMSNRMLMPTTRSSPHVVESLNDDGASSRTDSRLDDIQAMLAAAFAGKRRC